MWGDGGAWLRAFEHNFLRLTVERPLAHAALRFGTKGCVKTSNRQSLAVEDRRNGTIVAIPAPGFTTVPAVIHANDNRLSRDDLLIDRATGMSPNVEKNAVYPGSSRRFPRTGQQIGLVYWSFCICNADQENSGRDS